MKKCAISPLSLSQAAALDDGVLTQLGGAVLLAADRAAPPLFEYRDVGICATADFEAVLEAAAPAAAAAAAPTVVDAASWRAKCDADGVVSWFDYGLRIRMRSPLLGGVKLPTDRSTTGEVIEDVPVGDAPAAEAAAAKVAATKAAAAEAAAAKAAADSFDDADMEGEF